MNNFDLQAQILHELQQANNLAKNTHKNVKKIAKTAKANFLTTNDLDRLEDEISNQGGHGGRNDGDGGSIYGMPPDYSQTVQISGRGGDRLDANNQPPP